MKANDVSLGVIGAGVMGRTLIQGLIDAKVFRNQKIWAATSTEKSAEKVRSELGISVVTDYAKELAKTEVVLLCVKPKQVKAVLEGIRKKIRPSTLVISIAAGVSLEQLEEGLQGKFPIVRAMTNTPCMVRMGMTAIVGGKWAKAEHLELAQKIFESVGVCIPLAEHHFNAITGLGGSGPAYLYLIMEALADGGVRVGLPREVALKVVTQTVLGAATMVEKMGRHPASLRDDVTTPAGCTIGGLLTMEDGKIRSVLARTVEEATRIASLLG